MEQTKHKPKNSYRTRSVDAFPLREYYSVPGKYVEYQKDLLRKLGNPGEFPFTRGIYSEMYRTYPWVTRFYSGYGLPEDSNKRFKKLIDLGVEGISVALDLPSQIGLDSDHTMAEGEVGKVGVAIDSLEDLEILFDGIAIEKLKQIGMLGNSFGAVALGMFIALIEKRGLSLDDVVVELQNDVLKEYFTRGTQIFPLRPSIRVATDVIRYCSEKNLSDWHAMNICGYHASAAGPSWELAFVFEDAKVYINDLLNKGLNIDDFAHLFMLFLSISDLGIDMFEEVAKARAARRIWAKILKEEYDAKNKESLAIRIMAFVRGGATAQQPLNNITRIAVGTQNAILAGINYLHTACWDEGLSIPSEEAVEIAVRTQQILRHESGSVVATADPLGGSYLLEELTNRLEENVFENMKTIQEQGGAIDAIEKGFYQQKIYDGATKFQKEIGNGDRKIVGVNIFKKQEVIPLSKFKLNPETEEKKKKGLDRLKKTRNNKKVNLILDKIKEVAKSEKNLVPIISEAAREYATIGEICDALKEVYGEYSEGAIYF
jgi:methylmalonyl-CoA mutase, N-terminal domain